MIEADEGVDFRQLHASLGTFDDRQRTLVALGHATGDNQLLTLPSGRRFAIAHLIDGFEGFVLRGIDKGAGIDDDDVGLGRVGRHLHSRLRKVSHHDL